MHQLDFAIRELGLYLPTFKITDKLDNTSTHYSYTIISHPVYQDETIFSITATTTWNFGKEQVKSGWIVYFFPKVNGITNPTLEDLISLATKVKDKIDEVLPVVLARQSLATDLKIEPFREERDLSALRSAFDSWKRIN